MQQILDFQTLPKVALHDHLDGGLRPTTLLELARQQGVKLPAGHAQGLRDAIAVRTNSGSLVDYLEAFSWTVPVMQTESALARIAREAVEDLANDGVVLAEIRFAPLLHTCHGLSPQQVVDAVTQGLEEGESQTGVPTGLILCGIRSNDEFEQVAELFLANRYPGSKVIGVDLAGPECGHPASHHPALAALHVKHEVPITIHAGEAAGVESIWEALDAGARRIGHGLRLIDDILGDRKLLNVLRDRGILLEVCLTSNLQTGGVARLDLHPVRRFIDEGLRVNLDTDNRLMSATSYSREQELAHRTLGVTEQELLKFSKDALEASFHPEDVKAAVKNRLG